MMPTMYAHNAHSTHFSCGDVHSAQLSCGEAEDTARRPPRQEPLHPCHRRIRLHRKSHPDMHPFRRSELLHCRCGQHCQLLEGFAKSRRRYIEPEQGGGVKAD